MPACPNGAEPKPGSGGITVFYDINWLPEPVRTLINMVSPLSLEQQVVAAVATNTLCSGNPDDPGELSLGSLAWDMVGAAVPNPLGSPGTLGWWIGQKLQYYAFLQYCQCKVQTEVPPPIIVPTPPAGAPIYPTDPEAQPQLDRIEKTGAFSPDGLTTIYNGLQMGMTDVRDMAYRSRPSFITIPGTVPFTMQGEGQTDLYPYQQGEFDASQDVFGIAVYLTAIPSTVARRGVVNQRLYGVGSVEWNVEVQPSYPNTIAQRDSIHYERQFIVAPQHSQVWSVRWRLQPGVVAEGRQLFRAPDTAIYAPLGAYHSAYQEFSTWSPPPNWSDRPFYPLTSAQRSALPGKTS